MVKLSFIVPVYGVEQYLRKCVDSLLAQDLPSSEYEIILVDDESPDACPQICDDYAAAYKNISVVHQANGGLSAARNAGLKAAKGEYVCFVDSDDYWEPNVLVGLMEQVERDKLDVLRFKYQNVNQKYEVFNPYKRDQRLDNDYSEIPTDGVSFLNSRMNTQCYAVMFIIKRDLIVKSEELRVKSKDCLFTKGIYFEDTDWTPRMLARAKRVASTDTIVYNYLMREGSITNAINRSKQKKVLDDKMHLIATLQQQAIDLKKSGRYNCWYQDMISDTVVSVVSMLGVEFYEEKDSYLEQLQKLNIYPIKNRSIKTRLINISPRIMVEILHLKNAK